MNTFLEDLKNIFSRVNGDKLAPYCLFAVKAGLWLMLFTPLVYSPITISISTFSEVIFFRTILEIIAVFWVILLLLNWSAYRPRLSPIFVALIFFTASLTLSSILGFSPMRSFFGTLSRQEGVLTSLHLLVFFMMLISVLKEKKDWLLMFRTFVLVSIPVAMAGITQLLSLNWFKGIGCFPPECWRISATLGNSGFYGKYLMLVLFTAFFLFIVEEKKSWKGLSIALMVLNGILLLINGTRAAWVGTAVGAMVFSIGWFFWIHKGKLSKRFLQAIGIAAIVIFVLGMALVSQKDRLKNTIVFERAKGLVSDVMNRQNPRFSLWKVGLQAWKEHPILGTGLESFMPQYDRFNVPEFRFSRIPELENFDRAHNVYVDMLVTGGIVGLLSYLALYSIVFMILIRSRVHMGEKASLTLIAFFAAHLTYNIFGFDLMVSYVPLLIVLAFVTMTCEEQGFPHFLVCTWTRIARYARKCRNGIGGLLARGYPRAHCENMKPPAQHSISTTSSQKIIFQRFPQTPVSVALFVIATLSVYFFNVKPFLASFSVVKANDLLNEGKVKEAIAMFQKAPQGVNSWIEYDARRTIAKILHRAWQLPFDQAVAENWEKRQQLINALPSHLFQVELHLKDHGPDTYEMSSYMLAIESYLALYTADHTLSHLVAAERNLKKALAMNSHIAILHQWMSMIATLEGRLSDALQAAKASYDLFPDQGIYLELQGKAYSIAGRNNAEREKGVTLLRESLKHTQFYTKEKFKYSTVEHLAGLYHGLGAVKPLADFYEEVLERYPHDLPPDGRLFAALEAVYRKLGEKKKAEALALRWNAAKPQ